MGFFKDLFKADREYEEELRRKTIENQVKIWEIKSRMGEPVNIQADMEKIYDLDKLEQKQREKQQTKEIIKGAVTGGIIAGDAGAVVGAMVSKNRIDNRNNQSNIGSTQYTSTPYERHVSPTFSTGQENARTSSENYSSTQSNDIPHAIRGHGSESWNVTKNQLLNDSNAKTGDIAKDVEYCISRLEVVLVRDLTDIISQPISKTRVAITPLMDANKVKRIEYSGKAYFVWCNNPGVQSTSKKSSEALTTATALNFYGSEAWKRAKATLVENGFTRTGNLQTDILYCLSQLKIATAGELAEILNERITVVRPKLTPLMDDETVKRIEHNGKAVFVITHADFNSQAAAPVVPSSNVNKFEEIKQYKELLDLGILSQEEFEAKKIQLLGSNTVIQNNSPKETISDKQTANTPQNVISREKNIDLQTIKKYYRTGEWYNRKKSLDIDFKKAKTNNIEQDFLYVITRLQIAQKYDVLYYFFEEQDELLHAIDEVLETKKVEQRTVNNKVYYSIPGIIK